MTSQSHDNVITRLRARLKQNQKKAPQEAEKPQKPPHKVKEYGGPKGVEPTRYHDWERKGIARDF